MQTEKPTLVLLPGLSFDARVFERLSDLLGDRFCLQAVNYDEIGNADMGLDEWFAAFVDKMPASAHYIGWSVGGLFAWRLAQRDPARVLSIASFASSPCFLEKTDWPGVQAVDWEPFADSSERMQQKMQKRLLCLQGDRAVMRELGVLQLVFPFKSWDWGLAALAQWDMRYWLQQTNVPLLLVFAQQDALLPSVALSDKLQPAHRVRSLSAGHACVYSDPAGCLDVLEEFWGEF